MTTATGHKSPRKAHDRQTSDVWTDLKRILDNYKHTGIHAEDVGIAVDEFCSYLVIGHTRAPRCLAAKAVDVTPKILWELAPQERVDILKIGFPAGSVSSLACALNRSFANTALLLGLPESTIARKIKEGKVLNSDQSERVLQIVRLIGLTQKIVAEYGDPELLASFDAAEWLGTWIERPQPSLGMKKPSEYLDSATGIEMVETLLKRIAMEAFA